MADSAGIPYAIPQEILPPVNVSIHPGISYEQFEVLPTNQINGTEVVPGLVAGGAAPGTSTNANTEIQFQLGQYNNAFFDCRTMYFHGTAVVGLYNDGGATAANLPCKNSCLNGFVRGSFYSQFFRYASWANSSVPIDDITYIGILAKWLFQLTMNRTMRQCVAAMWGFTIDSMGNNGVIAGAGFFGSFPECGLVSGGGQPTTVGGFAQFSLAALTYTLQQFNFCLPLIGALGIGNNGLYPCWTGPTRLSFFTDAFSNFTWMARSAYADGVQITATPLQTGLLTISSWVLKNCRIVGHIVKCSPEVMSKIISALPDPTQYVIRVTSYTMSTGVIPSGTGGVAQVLLNVRVYSAKFALVLFNPDYSVVPATYSTFDQPFGALSSVCPNLFQGTFLNIQNERYPRTGFNPAFYPSQVMAENLKCLGAFTSANGIRPAIHPGNFQVIDNAGVAAYSRYNWRTHLFKRDGAAVAGVPNIPPLTAMQSPSLLLGLSGTYATAGIQACTVERFATSNDYYMMFELEGYSKPTYVSGTSLNSTSNYLNMNIVPAVAANYTVYFFIYFDMIISFSLQTGDVQVNK